MPPLADSRFEREALVNHAKCASGAASVNLTREKLSNLQFQSLQIPSLQIPSIADPKSANSKFADSLCSDWCGVRCRGRRLDYFGGSASGRGGSPRPYFIC